MSSQKIAAIRAREFEQLAPGYFAYCAISPLAKSVRDAMTATIDDYASSGMSGFLAHLEERDEIRALCSELFGGDTTEWAMVPNTTYGIHGIASAVVPQSKSMLLFDGEFPGNVNPWRSVADLSSCKTTFMSREKFATDIASALSVFERVLQEDKIDLVAVSWVQFDTGLAMPIAEMGAIANRHGARFVVDAIQGIGAVPLNLSEMNVDSLVAGGHKWLMCPEGIGLLYAKCEFLSSITGRAPGWTSYEDGMNFLFADHGPNYDLAALKTAARFEVGMMPSALMSGLRASLKLMQEFGIGNAFAKTSKRLSAFEQKLKARGFHSVRASHVSAQSSILSVKAPAHVDTQDFVLKAREKGLTITAPTGNIRFAPHWLTNDADFEFALSVVDELLV